MFPGGPARPSGAARPAPCTTAPSVHSGPAASTRCLLGESLSLPPSSPWPRQPLPKRGPGPAASSLLRDGPRCGGHGPRALRGAVREVRAAAATARPAGRQPPASPEVLPGPRRDWQPIAVHWAPVRADGGCSAISVAGTALPGQERQAGGPRMRAGPAAGWRRSRGGGGAGRALRVMDWKRSLRGRLAARRARECPGTGPGALLAAEGRRAGVASGGAGREGVPGVERGRRCPQ